MDMVDYGGVGGGAAAACTHVKIACANMAINESMRSFMIPCMRCKQNQNQNFLLSPYIHRDRANLAKTHIL